MTAEQPPNTVCSHIPTSSRAVYHTARISRLILSLLSENATPNRKHEIVANKYLKRGMYKTWRICRPCKETFDFVPNQRIVSRLHMKWFLVATASQNFPCPSPVKVKSAPSGDQTRRFDGLFVLKQELVIQTSAYGPHPPFCGTHSFQRMAGALS